MPTRERVGVHSTIAEFLEILPVMIRNTRSSSTLSTMDIESREFGVMATRDSDASCENDNDFMVGDTSEVVVDMPANMTIDVSTASHFDKSSCETVSTHRTSPRPATHHELDEPSKCLPKFLVGFTIVLVLGLLTAVTTILVGAKFESKRMAKASATSAAATDIVCATMFPDKVNSEFKSIESSEAAKAGAYQIAHCSSCGECSNPSDIASLSPDTNSLDNVIVTCGRKNSKRQLNKCLEDKLGLSEFCHDCWSEYTSCSADRCRFTCLKPVNGAKCAECREVLCGEKLTKCSGATRKTLGFVDYEDEACQTVDLRYPTSSR